MLSLMFRTRCLMLLLSPLAVSGCATPAPTFQTYPPVVDLAVEAKPVPTIDILTSAVAAANHNIAVETWGERGWRTVGRVCLWAKERGMPTAPC